MGRVIDYASARNVLSETFSAAEEDVRTGAAFDPPKPIAESTERLFASRTQAYREALVGCALMACIDPDTDIRYPIADYSENAFSGRNLDEQVVNPFFQDRAVPVSKNPYLSAIRRGVRFIPGGASGQKDMAAFEALVKIVAWLRKQKGTEAQSYLRYLLAAFVRLRDAANIPVRKIGRLSVEQYGVLVDGLLATASGGLMPVILATAMFKTVKDCFGLDWRIETQGINAADAVSGAGGDITVRRNGTVMLVVEVTERPIGRDRVVSTFNTKISPNGLDDYLFFYSAQPPSEDARAQARKYFAQGHDINFVRVRDWIVTILNTIGPKCRAMFTAYCVAGLEAKGVSATVKQVWNDQVAAVAGR